MSSSSQSQEASSIGEARRRLGAVEATLNSFVVGCEDLIRALLLAAIAKEHVVVICPTGTAKASTVVTALAKLLDARLYYCLPARSMRYDELFGPVDPSTLRRNWSEIMSSDLVFLDHVSDVGPAIASVLSSLLLNRTVYDPLSGQAVKARLWTAIGASSKAPEDPELRTLYDHFAIKAFIDRLPDEHFTETFRVGLLEPSVKPLASMNDVRVLHDHAMALLEGGTIEGLGRIRELCYARALPLVGALRVRGAVVSDDLIIERLLKLCAAYLSLYGITIDNVANSPYDLVLYLARTEKELRDIKEVVDDVLGELAELAKKLEKAKKLLLADNVQGAEEAFREVLGYDVKRFERAPWLKSRAEAMLSSAKRYLKLIEEKVKRPSQLRS